MRDLRLCGAALSLLACASCGASSDDLPQVPQRQRQSLSPLQFPCVFTAATYSLAITLAPGEECFIERRSSDSALLVNGEVCLSTGGTNPFAKSTTALYGAVTGDSAGAELLTLDFVNGTFFRGTAVRAGLVVDLLGGGDTVQVRMSGGRDNVRVGVGGWDISGDGVRDFTLANVTAVTVTLGDGDDIFSGLGGGSLGMPSAASLPLTVYGGNGNDSLTGGDGDDVLYGDVGADTLNGGTSATDSDTYHGGAGTDTVTWASRTVPIIVTVGSGADDGVSGESDDVGLDIEVVIGGSAADSFTGAAGPQTFMGGPGDDVFEMGLLASTGAGADTIYGEAGTDTVNYGDRLEAITVTMDMNVANDGNAAANEQDNIRSDVENIICPTAAVACVVTGNALNNRIVAGGGVDTLNGGAGDDRFVVGDAANVGAGADSFVGGVGVDVVDFSQFNASLNVRMDNVVSVTHAKKIGLDVENLICPPASACTVLGNLLGNHLEGSSATDSLSGAGGDDFIETNGGGDAVDCGDGSDILVGSDAVVAGATCEL